MIKPYIKYDIFSSMYLYFRSIDINKALKELKISKRIYDKFCYRYDKDDKVWLKNLHKDKIYKKYK